MTRDWLFRAAAHYVERYAATEETLRRVLTRKVARRRRELGGADGSLERSEVGEGEAGQDLPLIEETIAHFITLKLIDDMAFAQARFASLRRRGSSLRQASAKLQQKGVDRETIAATVRADETGDRMAAHLHAKRRRLGPHRLRPEPARRDRDIAAMLSAGFSLQDARAAIDGDGSGEE